MLRNTQTTTNALNLNGALATQGVLDAARRGHFPAARPEHKRRMCSSEHKRGLNGMRTESAGWYSSEDQLGSEVSVCTSIPRPTGDPLAAAWATMVISRALGA